MFLRNDLTMTIIVERLQREIESTDRAIDRLVYELYSLTEDEAKIVEG